METAQKPAPVARQAATEKKPDEPSLTPDLAFNPTLPPGYDRITVEGHRVTREEAESRVASTTSPNSAAEGGLEEVVVDSQAELRQAAEDGDIKALQSLLQHHGTNVNSRDEAGRTALLLATLQGQTAAVKLLLAHGADPNIADANGTTPLRAAKGRSAIVTALRRAGAH